VGASLDLPPSLEEVHPRRLGNLRIGQELHLVGKLREKGGGENGGGKVVLRGSLGGRTYRLAKTLRLKDDPEQQNPLVPRLWAEARIAELEGSRAADAVAEAIRLSKRHHVMSRHTALLVLENERMFSEFGIRRTQRRHKRASHSPGEPASADDLTAPWGEVDALGARGNSWAQGQADSFGPAGLGLEGIGEGGSGRGEGIGLGSVGTIGVGAGTGTGQGFGAPSTPRDQGSVGVVGSGLGLDSGQGFGSGHGFGSGSGRLGRAHRARPPRVRMGATNVTGRLPPEVIQRIVRQNFGRFRLCYESALRNNPALRGTVVVRFVIGRDGRVANVSGSGNLPDEAMVSCVVRAFYGLSFPQPEGGIVNVSYPIAFTPSNEAADRSSQPSRSAPPGALRASRLAPPGSLRANRAAGREVDLALLGYRANARQRGGSSLFWVAHHAADDGWRETDEVAVELLREVVRQSPQSRRAHVALVRGLLMRGRFDAALEAAQSFADLDPDMPLARELLAQAAAATGDGPRAVAALASQLDVDHRSPKQHQLVARAYEMLGDERRACAHWQAAAALRPQSDRARFEALRCRARVLGELDEALAEARAISQPGKLVRKLIATLEAGKAPPFDASADALGWFEAKVRCEGEGSCPVVVVLAPGGRIYSPWTPPTERTKPGSVSFGDWTWNEGTYRTLLVAAEPGARGELELRAGNKHQSLAFEHRGGVQSVAATYSRGPYRWGVRW